MPSTCPPPHWSGSYRRRKENNLSPLSFISHHLIPCCELGILIVNSSPAHCRKPLLWRHSRPCNDSRWQWGPVLEPRTHLHRHVRAHSGAFVLLRRSGVRHWLSVSGQVNLLRRAAQQQQALNRPLVWAPTALRQEGWRLKWSETCSYRVFSWICSYYVCVWHLVASFPCTCVAVVWCTAFFHQLPVSHSLIHSVGPSHTWQLPNTTKVFQWGSCRRSCRGLIASLKGIIVINTGSGESAAHFAFCVKIIYSREDYFLSLALSACPGVPKLWRQNNNKRTINSIIVLFVC